MAKPLLTSSDAAKIDFVRYLFETSPAGRAEKARKDALAAAPGIPDLESKLVALWTAP